MVYTERIMVIRIVRETKRRARAAKSESNLAEYLEKLDKLIIQIEDLEDELIFGEIEEKVTVLTRSCKRLKRICSELNSDIQKLAEITDYVDKAADGIKILTKVATFSSAIIS